MAEKRALKEYAITSSDEPYDAIVCPTVEASGGALMNKTYTGAYDLIENMAHNHYQWTSERVITEGTPPPSKKEAGMCQVSTFDHLSAKVDTLLQKFDKLT
ncbi:hypothetical protein MTR_0145s0010, partial [Medicago truncatula]